MNYPMVIYPCEEGGFVAEIPALIRMFSTRRNPRRDFTRINDCSRVMVRNCSKIGSTTS